MRPAVICTFALAGFSVSARSMASRDSVILPSFKNSIASCMSVSAITSGVAFLNF